MKELALIIWMILTIILVCTIVGLLLFIPKDKWEDQENTPSTWMTIGRTLLNSVVNRNS